MSGAPISAQPVAEREWWVNPEKWVEVYGDLLFRHALLRVRDAASAEDLVQETLLAAWRSGERYSGAAPERHWLLGILKHKLADHFRRRARGPELLSEGQLAELEKHQFESGWLMGGHWATPMAPGAWADPARSLEQTEFWRTLYECLAKLPMLAARVFVLREVDQCDGGEICRTMNINQNHLLVLMHRSRLALRRCLELHWFRDPPTGESGGG